MRRLSRLLPCLLLAVLLPAASVDDIVADLLQGIPPEVLADADSTVVADRLAELNRDPAALGLDATGATDLLIREVEAWIGVRRGPAAETVAVRVLSRGELDDARRDRVGLSLVAAWQLQIDADAEKARTMPDPVARLDGFGRFGPVVRGRAHAVLGQTLSARDDAGYKAAFLQALDLLAAAPPADRVPIYEQAVAAMEKAKIEPKEIESWLLGRPDDPAAIEVVANLLTSAQKLVGQRAPPLDAPRLDGHPGRAGLADAAGRRLLVYFFSSWAKSCEAITPLVVQVAATGEIAVIGVCFDNRDTIDNLPGMLARYGISFPVIGERLGWDGEIDEAWRIDAIPQLVLVDKRGIVANADMIGTDARSTGENLIAALQALLAAERDAAAKPPEGGATIP
jgi:thiol-disulfide isomerase/thioredoxin